LKILIVASRFPYPIQKGDKLRLYNQMKTLSEHHELYLYTCSTHKVHAKDKTEVLKYCKQIRIHELDSKEIAANLFRTGLGKIPFQTGIYFNDQIQKEIETFVQEYSVEHIYCQLIRMAQGVRNIKLPKTIDYMDAFGFGMKQRAKMGGLAKKLIYAIESKRVKKYEKEIFPDFDHHTVITKKDKERIDAPTDKIHVIANGVDADFFTNTGGVEEFDIVFVGNMGYLPNIDAAVFLVQKILPKLIKKSGVNYKVLIAGARPTKQVIDLAKEDNVTVAGWMEDIRSAYKSGRMFIAPIFNGIGQQNKILEAISMEIPCIVNQSVAEGLGLEHEKHCLIAETADEFVNQVIELEKNAALMGSMIVQGKEKIQADFNWASQTKKTD